MRDYLEAVQQHQRVYLLQVLKRDDGLHHYDLVPSFLTVRNVYQLLQLCGQDSNLLRFELVKAVFGLSDNELGRLSMPDLNALVNLSFKLCEQSSNYWFTQLQLSIDDSACKLTLLIPIYVCGQRRRVLDVNLPTVDMFEKVRRAGNQEQWTKLVSDCVGLGMDDLGQLRVPDWLALNSKVRAFYMHDSSHFFRWSA